MDILEIMLILIAILILLVVIAVLVIVVKSRRTGGGALEVGAIDELLSKYAVANKLTIEESVKVINSMTGELMRMSGANIAESQQRLQEIILSRFDKLVQVSQEGYQTIDNKIHEQFKVLRGEVMQALFTMRQEEESRGKNLRDLLDRKVSDMQSEVKVNLTTLRNDNERKLNEMREVVDEKLQSTLNSRISESFKVINAQLESVNKGLGEMQNLTGSVDSLNRVLSNVKQRGVWGEVQLDNLLAQILTPTQYDKQVQISGDNRVDFAVIMPGKNDDKLILPLDAKFPLADYEKYIDACDAANKDDMLSTRKSLVRAIKEQAKSIKDKYINVPKTTSFAIMYLPIEGLYAELVREPGLMDDLHQNYNVLLSGPTTLTALLTSLQMGFRTLAIQKHSSEVWKTLSQFKKDFYKFAGLLDKTRKKASEIVDTIDDGIKRGEIINKKLNKLLDDGEIELLVGDEMVKEADND